MMKAAVNRLLIKKKSEPHPAAGRQCGALAQKGLQLRFDFRFSFGSFL